MSIYIDPAHQANINAMAAAPTFSAPLTQGGADVATSNTTVIAANTSRLLLVLTNASDTGIWLNLAASGATVGSGVYIAPGLSVQLPYKGAVSAIHGSTGTKRLGIVEL